MTVAGLPPGTRALFPRSRPGGGGGDSAASLLDRRFAAGEIDENTYRHLRSGLTGTS